MIDIPYFTPLLKENRPIWIMGVHDVLSAKIAEKAGYDAVGVQSLQMAFVNGLPDTGVMMPTELLETVRKIRRAIDLPIMVDFEQGFGDPYAAVHWMNEFERAGAAACHIDDCGMLYKCVFCPPHVPVLETKESTCDKIRAMAGEKLDENFLIMGRTVAYACTALKTEEERRQVWVERSQAYKEAGSDAIFAIAPSLEHAKFFRSQIEGPMVIIRTLGTEMKQKENRLEYDDSFMKATVQDLYEIGYQLQNEPSTLLGVAAQAMMKAAVRERASGRMYDLEEEHGNLYDILDTWMDVPNVKRIRSTYCQ
ncbi:MAG: isocitrate lyase/PEP mutase family protein [Pirellulaceae bacterium]|nr:isocitrate lyase/PEP mutase family protein [Pirellulaceae bacterium]